MSVSSTYSYSASQSRQSSSLSPDIWLGSSRQIESQTGKNRLQTGCDCGSCPQCGANDSRSRLVTKALGEAAVFEKSEIGHPSESSVAIKEDEEHDSMQLTESEQAEIRALKQRDQEVRQHEHAHLAAAGPYARGGPTYEYEIGPDGHRYAVGGEVQIDTSPIPDDPQATIQKAQTIKRAALAPAHPSDQDFRVAAQADQLMREAQQELAATIRESTKQSYNSQGKIASTKEETAIFDLIV